MEPTDPIQPDGPESRARPEAAVDDDARLDALLAQARWPEPGDDARRRLEAAWTRVSPARAWWRRQTPRRFAMAAAAVVALASGVTLLRLLQPERAVTGTAISVVPPPAPVTVSPVEISPNAPTALPTPPPTLHVAGSREPTARERLLTLEASSRARNHGGEDARLLRRATPESIEAYLARVADRQTRSAALAALDRLPNPPVEALLDQFANPRVAIRYAAARALGRIDGPATTAALIERIERGDRRRESIAALLCSRGEHASNAVGGIRSSTQLAAVVQAAEVQLRSY